MATTNDDEPGTLPQDGFAEDFAEPDTFAEPGDLVEPGEFAEPGEIDDLGPLSEHPASE